MGGENKIKRQTQIVFVRDDFLACALIAKNVAYRDDPPYVKIKYANGKIKKQWSFEAVSADGLHRTLDLIKAWKQGVDAAKKDIQLSELKGKLISDNSKSVVASLDGHPFSDLVQAEMNRRLMVWWFTNHDRKFRLKFQVPSEDPEKQIFCWPIEGSNEHQKCINEGYKQL